MSRENVEIVRQMWEALLGADPMSGLSFCDPDIEWDGTNLPDGKVARGHEAIVEHLMRWAEMWDDWGMEPERFIDAGGDQVVLVFREMGRSESGLQMDERIAPGQARPAQGPGQASAHGVAQVGPGKAVPGRSDGDLGDQLSQRQIEDAVGTGQLELAAQIDQHLVAA